MAPTTPSSTKGSNKKTKSSASKKNKDQDTPLADRRVSKTFKKLAKASADVSMALDAPPKPPTPDDEEMTPLQIDLTTSAASTAPAEPLSTISTKPTPSAVESTSVINSQHTTAESNKSKSTIVSSDNDSSDEEDEIILQSEVAPAVLDNSGTEITGGHIVINPPSDLQISAYPKPSELKLFTVNPLAEPRRPGLSPTSNLPFELQLWWNLYSECHALDSDVSLWAMVTLMNDTRKLSDLEIIKLTLSSSINYFEPIVGPGSSKFVLVRFKSHSIKDNFRRNNRLDRGVFVYLAGSIRTSLLIFNLEPVSKLTPHMSSLLVSISGLPYHLYNRDITEELYHSLIAHRSNDHLSITFINEPNPRPTLTFAGARIFEIHFLRSAAAQWFKLLSQQDFLFMTPWNRRGDEYKHRTIITQWKFIPTCSTCGTSSYDASHRIKCPFATIRDDLFRSIENSFNNRAPTDLTDDTTPVVSFPPKVTKTEKICEPCQALSKLITNWKVCSSTSN
ncbi:uncharacterized protein MELLADRAFT_90057 [Melampsora larici-populina 98AG31]|uniref:Uncharacterized protein n=1 Tax=Melampsora larici-populina (strain 98AG31 / pathotype 3-4-7) TaxID=747676 RepID=F4RVK1_MELLP|nr:uncharacterized protein MELLADRAFT_90057 [Melampsora larici-populina 98AG31]EGG03653.1 hypothetical protein MELLADRAFT_90057 [Melampsora larici-populina 98AG31]